MLRVIPLLLTMKVRSRMEYRASFFIDALAMILTYGSVYATFWVLLLRFQTLDGWDWPELAVLLSFQLFTYAVGASFSFTQFRDMEEKVRLGQLDVLLVKPFSPWAFLTFGGYNLGYIAHISLAIGLMIWAAGQVDVTWSVGLVLYLVGAIVSAALLVAAIMTMIGASSIVLVQSRYLYSIFFGFWELSRFPLTIYPAALQWAMITVMPLAFLSYVPAATFLGKDVAILGGWGMPLSLLAGPLAVALAILHWRWSLRHYQGGGG
jgi:ABC-2 type transport system permease protein